MKKEIIPHSIPLEITMAFPERAVKALAKFYQTVHTSDRFIWIGIVRTIDELESQRLRFYLLERANNLRGIPVDSEFDKLATALKPDFGATLYFASETDYSPNQFPQLLQEYNKKEAKQDKLIWEQILV